MSATDLILRRRTTDWVELVASGSWTAEHAAAIDAAISKMLVSIEGSIACIAVDLEAIDQLDTYGAWLIERLRRDAKARGATLTRSGLSPRFEGIVSSVATAPAASISTPQKQGLLAPFAILGETIGELAPGLESRLKLLGAIGVALVLAIRRPWTFRSTSVAIILTAWPGRPYRSFF